MGGRGRVFSNVIMEELGGVVVHIILEKYKYNYH